MKAPSRATASPTRPGSAPGVRMPAGVDHPSPPVVTHAGSRTLRNQGGSVSMGVLFEKRAELVAGQEEREPSRLVQDPGPARCPAHPGEDVAPELYHAVGDARRAVEAAPHGK